MYNLVFSVQDIVILLGAIISLLLSIAFLSRKTTKANYFIAILLVVCCLRLWLKYLDESGAILQLPHFANFNHFLGVITPPLFYLYMVYLLSPKKKIKTSIIIHLIIPFLVLLYFTPYYIMPAEDKVAVLTGRSPHLDVRLPEWFGYFGIVYSVGYLIASASLLYKEVKYSNRLEKNVVVWLGFLLAGYFIFIAFALFNAVTPYFSDVSYLAFQILSLCIIIGCLKLLSIPNVINEPKVKYANSRLSSPESSELLEHLNNLMKDEKLFINPKIRLKTIALKLNINENQLSQIINEHHKMSFNDWINSYRVDLAKDLLIDPNNAHLTIEGIGYSAGFNSRTSFYSAFKNHFGITPRQFQNTNQT